MSNLFHPDYPHLRLGKKAKRVDKRTLKFGDYLPPQLPPIPSACDWTGKVSSFPMLGNDTCGDCTVAGANHLNQVWTSQASTEIIATTESAIADYSAMTGYDPADPTSDMGDDLLSVLNYWRQTGINGRKILAFVEVDITNLAHLKAAIAIFGGIYGGVQLPKRALQQFSNGERWEDTAPDIIAGGHELPPVSFDTFGPGYVKVPTWARIQYASWPWLLMYLDEAYCVLSRDWLNANGVSPSHFNLAQLQADLQAIEQT